MVDSMRPSDRPQVRSSGVIVFRKQPQLSFLLMKHANRWDLPKGHVDPGESDIECALRELDEETGIQRDDIKLDLSAIVDFPERWHINRW